MVNLIAKIRRDLFDVLLIHIQYAYSASNTQMRATAGDPGEKGLLKLSRQSTRPHSVSSALTVENTSHCKPKTRNNQDTSAHTNGISDTVGSDSSGTRYPEGTVLIIPPQPQDYNPQCPRLDMRWKRARKRARGRGARRRARGVANTTAYAPAAPSKKHWMVCLFMSWHYGPRNRGPSEVALRNTVSVLVEFEDAGGEIPSGRTGIPINGIIIQASIRATSWLRRLSINTVSCITGNICLPPLENADLHNAPSQPSRNFGAARAGDNPNDALDS
ncbi:hypothetical protein CIHG_06489 [Coccidioides immitis H538.4]|uniref:Uncharacterized protein n=1 Tax=Coccidioides immitis H538.4 TaxID=396776 RepID=A0A0J8RVK0_COCIT|nr:hypothetical protein CIHG_06489 [Coccidioides immitis H538.4]